MQHINWDNLRVFIAVSRSRSFSDAASVLGVDGTTVSRRVKALEQLLGTPLIQYNRTDSLQLTEAGQIVAESAEIIEREIDNIQESVLDTVTNVEGRVLVTAVPVIINNVLIPAINTIAEQYPNLEVHLISDNRNLSLTNREADIALRLARPTDGGYQIKMRQIASLEHAVYTAKNHSGKDIEKIPWITYQDAMAHLPQAQWIQKELCQSKGVISNIRVNDINGAIEAIAYGSGKTVLPCLVGDADVRMRRLKYKNKTSMFNRDIWLLARVDTLHLGRIRAVIDWLDSVFGDTPEK